MELGRLIGGKDGACRVDQHFAVFAHREILT